MSATQMLMPIKESALQGKQASVTLATSLHYLFIAFIYGLMCTIVSPLSSPKAANRIKHNTNIQ